MERKGHVHRREISQGFVRSARVTHVRNFVRNLWVRNEICVGEICVILKRNVGPGQMGRGATKQGASGPGFQLGVERHVSRVLVRISHNLGGICAATAHDGFVLAQRTGLQIAQRAARCPAAD